MKFQDVGSELQVATLPWTQHYQTWLRLNIVSWGLRITVLNQYHVHAILQRGSEQLQMKPSVWKKLKRLFFFLGKGTSRCQAGAEPWTMKKNYEAISLCSLISYILLIKFGNLSYCTYIFFSNQVCIWCALSYAKHLSMMTLFSNKIWWIGI